VGSQARLINIKTGAYSRTPHAVFVGIFCYWGLEGIKESNASKKSILGYPIFIGSSIYLIGTLGVQGGLEI
jgi:hypothetical protein